MLVAVVADKGAPGVTTSCLALALGWPRPVLLAECDPAGADLPWRLTGAGGRPLVQGTGLVSLATAGRGLPTGTGSQAVQQTVWEHVQQLDGGLGVLIGPPGPEQAEAMGGAWGMIADLLAGLPGTDVVADCGRLLSRSSPVVPLVQRADLVVVVTRTTVSGVAHARHGLGVAARIRNDGPQAGLGSVSGLDRLAVLVVVDPATPGSRKAHQRQVDEVLADVPGLQDVPVVGVLAYDPRTAAALNGHPRPGRPRRALDRSPLLRSAADAARALVARADELQLTQVP